MAVLVKITLPAVIKIAHKKGSHTLVIIGINYGYPVNIGQCIMESLAIKLSGMATKISNSSLVMAKL